VRSAYDEDGSKVVGIEINTEKIKMELQGRIVV
jgi:hypothetical protein